MIFSSPYYWLNKKTLKHFDLRAKDAPVGNMLAAIWIKDQQMAVPALVYKDGVRIGMMVKAHLFFTDKGIFLTNDQLTSDFFAYNSIMRMDIKKSFLTSRLELHLRPELISNNAMDMIDLPLKNKAARRILNLKNDLSQYVSINDISKK